jgi:hypothetical protein
MMPAIIDVEGQMERRSGRPAWWWAMQAFWASLAIWAVTFVLILFTGAGSIDVFTVINQWAPAALVVFAILSWLLYRIGAATRR